MNNSMIEQAIRNLQKISTAVVEADPGADPEVLQWRTALVVRLVAAAEVTQAIYAGQGDL